MGKTSLCQGRKQISISYCTSCRLRHGELSGKTMAPSSLSYEAILSNTDVQAVKSPQLHQLSLLCLGPASGLWHERLLPPHKHFHHWIHFHCREWGHATPGQFQLSVKQTDRQPRISHLYWLSWDSSYAPVTIWTPPWPRALQQVGSRLG